MVTICHAVLNVFAFLYVKVNSEEICEEIFFPSFFRKILLSSFLFRLNTNAWLPPFFFVDSLPSSRRKTKCRNIVTNKVTLWSASYSACVLHTETIIHLNTVLVKVVDIYLHYGE